jgi:predicted transcriptional regulator
MGCKNYDVVHAHETTSPVTGVEVSKDGQYITTADSFSVKFWNANQSLQQRFVVHLTIFYRYDSSDDGYYDFQL